jgi:hypothetical protein
MTQSNELSQRIEQAEGQIVDLQMTANLILQAINKNSSDIAVLIEVSRHNSDNMSALQLAQMRTEAALQVFQQHTDEAIERLTTNSERIEQLLAYLIRQNREQAE